MSEKLQKVLARAGYGSRRLMETWIKAGRVKINKKIAMLGDRVSEQDSIALDGKALSKQKLFSTKKRVLIYNKDAGSICSRSDPEGRRTIFEDLPGILNARWISVGRLDISTTGLLLLTTDGELANALMHPSHEVIREYLVRILGKVDSAMLKRLQTDVELEDGMGHFTTIVDNGDSGANHWYRVSIVDGRNRIVRRLWESQGLKVSRLKRVSYGPISLPRMLRMGRWSELEFKELTTLYKSVGLPLPEKVSQAKFSRALDRNEKHRHSKRRVFSKSKR